MFAALKGASAAAPHRLFLGMGHPRPPRARSSKPEESVVCLAAVRTPWTDTRSSVAEQPRALGGRSAPPRPADYAWPCYGAMGGMVDALRRRSGRRPPLWVLSSGCDL